MITMLTHLPSRMPTPVSTSAPDHRPSATVPTIEPPIERELEFAAAAVDGHSDRAIRARVRRRTLAAATRIGRDRTALAGADRPGRRAT